MKYFTFKTLQELEQAVSENGARSIAFEHDPEKIKAALARRVEVGGAAVGNSIAIHPMEGCDSTPEGAPGDLTWRRYRRWASGGAKLLWFEATAVSGESRANPRQLWLQPKTMPEFARLLETVRREHAQCFGTSDDLLDVLQLTHSGRHSAPSRIVAYHNPALDKKTGIAPDAPLISDGELERVEDEFVEAARLAADAGFCAVVKNATQGLLADELLGAKTREGRYGGPLENRARFLGNVIGKIRALLGERLILCVRLGCYDGLPFARGVGGPTGAPLEHPVPYPYGFGVDTLAPEREDLVEVKRLTGWLVGWGVKLLNVSLGSPYANPHMSRPFEKPDEGNYEAPEHPLLGVDRHFRIAGELQRAFPSLPMVGTGYSWLREYMVHAAAHNIQAGAITLMGAGRNALAYPDFARDALERGALDAARVCKTDTFCSYLMRRKKHPLGQFPSGCVPFDKRVYGPIMKQARASERPA